MSTDNSMTGWGEQGVQGYSEPRQPDARERLRCVMEQTVWDRRLLNEMSSMTGSDLVTTLGDVALATVDSYQNGDSHRITERLERLYASLSIETFKGTISLELIDKLQETAMASLSGIENEELVASAKEALTRSRMLGLNPVYR